MALKPLVRDDVPTTFAVVDIETDRDGQPTLSGYYDGVDYQEFDSCDALVRHLIANATTIYAHCGCRFDYSLLLKYFLNYGEVSIAYSGTEGIFLRLQPPDKKEIKLLDSYRLLPLSLSKLTKKFLGEEQAKIDLCGAMPWDLTAHQLSEYLRRDCESLWLAIAKFWELIDKEFSPLRASTLSALSLKIFRRHYQKQNYMAANGKLYEYELSSYFGGVCHLESPPGTYNVRIFDINSMYPNAMACHRYPLSYVGRWTRKYYGAEGLYFVQYSHRGFPFVFDVGERKLSREGNAIVDNATFEYLREIGHVRLIKGYEYARTDYLFREFVTDNYKRRQESDPVLAYVFKILLNSLYGKFGQKRERRTISTKHPGSGCRYKTYPVRVSFDGIPRYREVFDSNRRVIVPHSMPAIASLVTLHSRRHLHQLAAAFPTIYSDTDSIHIDADRATHFPDTSNSLGGLKEEYVGRVTYRAKKIYQLHDAGIIKCKGIPNAALDGLDLRDLVSPRAFEFDNYPSILSQITSGTDFKTVSAKRTI
jgi:hypothetical protein